LRAPAPGAIGAPPPQRSVDCRKVAAFEARRGRGRRKPAASLREFRTGLRRTTDDAARRCEDASPMSVSTPIVAARGVRKTYDTGSQQVQALRGVDLDLQRGEMVAIM